MQHNNVTGHFCPGVSLVKHKRANINIKRKVKLRGISNTTFQWNLDYLYRVSLKYSANFGGDYSHQYEKKIIRRNFETWVGLELQALKVTDASSQMTSYLDMYWRKWYGNGNHNRSSTRYIHLNNVYGWENATLTGFATLEFIVNEINCLIGHKNPL